MILDSLTRILYEVVAVVDEMLVLAIEHDGGGHIDITPFVLGRDLDQT